MSERKTPLFSIVVPVYNVAAYLPACMASMTGQTLREIEILCVDDASTDGSDAILREWAAKDDRVRVTFHRETMTAAAGRKEGVLMSRGEYLLFVDPDDVLAENACEYLLREMRRHPVDMLQFAADAAGENGVTPERVAAVTRQLRPMKAQLPDAKNPELLDACFVENLFGYQLWNKCYRGDYARRAMAHCPDGYFPKAQDLLAFYVLLYFAESYRGMETPPLYHYTLGRGITGGARLTRKQITACAAQAKIPAALRDFAREVKGETRCEASLDAVYRRLLRDSMGRLRQVDDADFPFAWEAFTEAWGMTAAASQMQASFPYQYDLWARRLNLLPRSYPPARPVKTIGAFYYRVRNGGAQRVAANLCRIWRDMGLKVVLFTDEAPSDEDYPIPEDTVRIVLPTAAAGDFGETLTRFQTLADAVRAQEIDLFINHAWVSGTMLWEMLTVQAAGARYFMHCHSVFAAPLATSSIQRMQWAMPDIYRLADGVLALSRTDAAYWRNFNPRVMEIVNPLTFRPAEIEFRPRQGHTLLWVGRMSSEKRPVQVVEIFRRVAAEIPDARLIMVGDGTGSMMAAVQKAIEKAELQDRVELPGFHTDVTPFYERSDVYLCTSQYEGAPLTLLEAQCHGLPVVSYEMPWLSIFAHHLGSVTAPQEDKDGMAAALIRLFRDPETMLRLSGEARRNVDEYFDIDMQAQWRQVLAMAEQPAEPPAEDSEGALMVRTWNQLLQAQKKAAPGNAAERANAFAPVPLRGPFKMARKKIVTFMRVLLIDGFRGVRDVMEDKKHRH